MLQSPLPVDVSVILTETGEPDLTVVLTCNHDQGQIAALDQADTVATEYLEQWWTGTVATVSDEVGISENLRIWPHDLVNVDRCEDRLRERVALKPCYLLQGQSSE